MSDHVSAVIYPGTFDPVTLGHIDIVARASKLFKKVVVAIADSTGKKPLFSLAERVQLAQQVLKEFTNVEIIGFDCLLTELSKQLDISVIVRGLRAVTDFEYEFQLAMMNRHVKHDLETIFLTPSDKHMFVSSTLVREIASYGGDTAGFVHPIVAAALKIKAKK